MNKIVLKIVLVIAALVLPLGLPVAALAQEETIALPQVSEKSGADYFDCLRNRASIRAYADKDLSLQDLGDVLWTAGGLKSPGGKYVIPYAMHTDPTCKISVLGSKGAYLYEGEKHALELVLAEDLRTKATLQDFAHSAPYVLALVASPSPLANKLSKKSLDEVLDTVYLSCGAIMQDVYLAASAKGMATCYIASVKRDALKEPLKLKDDEIFFGAMPLGYVVE